MGIYMCNVKASGEAGAARCARRPSLIAAGAAAGFARLGVAAWAGRGAWGGFVPRVGVSLAPGCSPGAQNAPTSPPSLRYTPTLLHSAHPTRRTACPRRHPQPHATPAAAPAAPVVRGVERSEPPRLPPPPLHLYRLLSICNLRSSLLPLLLYLCNLRSFHL